MGEQDNPEGRTAGDNENENGRTAEDDSAAQRDSNREPDWKTEARKWEQRAKDNAAAAKKATAAEAKLREFEDQGKTELEKATARAADAERKAAAAEARALRYDIAARKGLPATLAPRLQGETPEELEADADTLLAQFGEDAKGGQRKPSPRRDPDQGKGAGQSPAGEDMNDWLRQAAGIRPA